MCSGGGDQAVDFVNRSLEPPRCASCSSAWTRLHGRDGLTMVIVPSRMESPKIASPAAIPAGEGGIEGQPVVDENAIPHHGVAPLHLSGPERRRPRASADFSVAYGRGYRIVSPRSSPQLDPLISKARSRHCPGVKRPRVSEAAVTRTQAIDID